MTLPTGSRPTVAVACAPFLGPCLAALGRRQHGRDVAHVGHAGLDHCSEADAVETPLRPRRVALCLQFSEPALLHRPRDGFLVIAGIEQCAGRGPIWKCARIDQVALDDVERVELEARCNPLHQTFQREIDLRSAKTAIEAGRRLVGDNDAVADADVAYVVGAGQVAVHAIERRGLRRAQVSAAILDLVPVECEDLSVGSDRRRQGRRAVGRRHRRGEMFEPVLDPFDRTLRDARGSSDQHDVWKHALLDAKAAAGIRRRAQPQAIALYFQRAGDHGVDAERTLKIGQHLIGILAGIVRGDDAIGLDRRAGVAGIANVDGETMRRVRKGLLGVAIAEGAIAGEVAGKAVMQHGRARRECTERIDDGAARTIFDVDELRRILGAGAVDRHDDRNGFADIAHAIDRDRPALDRCLHADDEAVGDGLDVTADQNRRNTREAPGSFNVDGKDVGMRVRRAQDRRVQRAGRDAEIVDEAAAAREQRGVLDALDRTPDPRLGATFRICGLNRSLHHVPPCLPMRSLTRR